MKKFVKLIMVTEENNNKFYNMTYDGTSPSFHVEYGRVEKTSVKETYPIGLWDKKYKEKVKKGFGDVMGGKVLELESDKLIQRGIEQGLEKGIQQGIAMERKNTELVRRKAEEEIQRLKKLLEEQNNK